MAAMAAMAVVLRRSCLPKIHGGSPVIRYSICIFLLKDNMKGKFDLGFIEYDNSVSIKLQKCINVKQAGFRSCPCAIRNEISISLTRS